MLHCILTTCSCICAIWTILTRHYVHVHSKYGRILIEYNHDCNPSWWVVFPSQSISTPIRPHSVSPPPPLLPSAPTHRSRHTHYSNLPTLIVPPPPRSIPLSHPYSNPPPPPHTHCPSPLFRIAHTHCPPPLLGIPPPVAPLPPQTMHICINTAFVYMHTVLWLSKSASLSLHNYTFSLG